MSYEGQLTKDFLDARGRELCARLAAETEARTVGKT